MGTLNPQCSNVGDCGEIGIYGSNLVCSKGGFCQNCQTDLECNGVDNPSGKCINNVCTCVQDSDCSCEGNDPYSCGQNNDENCVCSPKYRGLSDLKGLYDKPKTKTKSYVFIFFLLILCLNFYIFKISNLSNSKKKKILVYGNLLIFIIFGLNFIIIK